MTTFSRLAPFLFVFYISSFAFGDAFYTASKYHQKYKYDPEGETYYANYVDAFMASYNYMLAGTGTLDNSKSVLAFVLYQLAAIFIYLVLLNILIAFVCTTFEEV